MESFLPADLKPRHAILSAARGRVSLAILLSPFLIDGELVDTSIRLEDISLPSIVLSELAGHSFSFAVNPNEGYIDGSVYLDGVHHPVDVKSLTFHRSRAGGLTLLVKGVYRFGFEGLAGLGDVPLQMAVSVSSCAA